MKTRCVTVIAAAAIAIVGFQRGASAQSVEKGSFGAGLMVGEPIGVTAKLYVGDDAAFDAAVGSSLIGGGGLHVHADYLIHPGILEQRESFVMPVYVGGGLRLLSRESGGQDNAFSVGARVLVGMLFDFTEIPLDVFVEVAAVPDYQFTSPRGFGFDINAGLGVRYYF